MQAHYTDAGALHRSNIINTITITTIITIIATTQIITVTIQQVPTRGHRVTILNP